MDLKSLTATITVLCEIENEPLCDQLMARGRTNLIDGRVLLEWLNASPKARELVKSDTWRTWQQAGAVTDGWGNAILCSAMNKGDTLQIRLWSPGRNGKNEWGKGDDVEESFDVEHEPGNRR